MAELYAKRGVVMAADSQSEITTLHLVVSASGDEFRRCLSVTEADDCLVFADVGVLLLCRSDLDLEALGKLEPCALLRDLAVHGQTRARAIKYRHQYMPNRRHTFG